MIAGVFSKAVKILANALVSLVFLACFTTRADVPTPNKLPEMQAIVASMKNLSPHDIHFDYQPTPNWVNVDVPLDARVPELFKQIQLRFLGREYLAAVSCHSCVVETYLYDRITYIQPYFVSGIYANKEYTDPQSLVAFIAAHEIAHIIYDVYAEAHGKSVNGNPILYRDTFEGYWPFGHWNRARDPIGHMEVDTYALILMHEMGMSPPLDAAKLMNQMMSSEYSIHHDKRDLRISTINTMIQALWK